MRAPKCSNCNTSMEPGYIPKGLRYNKTKMEWFEGEAIKSVWRGLRSSGTKQYFVTAYHCPQCRKIDLYSEKSMEEF
jgi:uncharacterized protein DUF6487